jgi:putative FmdB family regulatory protein
MPLYEYTCRECGRRFEVLQRVGADGTGVTCPGCGASHVAKQLSTFASSVAGGTGAGGAMPCGAPSASGCGSGGFT